MSATLGFLDYLYEVVLDRIRSPRPGSYTATIAKQGLAFAVKKMLEESGELGIELLVGSKQRVVEEAADLLYHLLVALALKGVDVKEVARELVKRHESRTR
ncbi:MAG TPA: phosphoribosyl-ATP diphosphatase [Pyrodictiaceae archaeon]|nr:phosphoribosyl-ATP diphosphatase [Pyrodictiaceae archaeon]HIQ55149.1 phosphoribosyl-ATP diphosphatase [Pyrodictium sp.]